MTKSSKTNGHATEAEGDATDGARKFAEEFRAMATQYEARIHGMEVLLINLLTLSAANLIAQATQPDPKTSKIDPYHVERLHAELLTLKCNHDVLARARPVLASASEIGTDVLDRTMAAYLAAIKQHERRISLAVGQSKVIT